MKCNDLNQMNEVNGLEWFLLELLLSHSNMATTQEKQNLFPKNKKEVFPRSWDDSLFHVFSCSHLLIPAIIIISMKHDTTFVGSTCRSFPSDIGSLFHAALVSHDDWKYYYILYCYYYDESFNYLTLLLDSRIINTSDTTTDATTHLNPMNGLSMSHAFLL